MSDFTLPPARPRRRPSLTPMIDVVFLLLVFFMLASRFGMGQVLHLPLSGAAAPALSPETPRLVDVLPGGYRLNGVACDGATLLGWLAEQGDPAATVVVRAQPGADVQRMVDAAGLLRDAGYTALALIETETD